MLLLRTRAGRWFIVLCAAVGLGIAYTLPRSGSEPLFGSSEVSSGGSHRPGVAQRMAHIVTLRLTWGATRPQDIGWAIGAVETRVDMTLVPSRPPRFVQSLQYDPNVRYEIYSHGSDPTACSIELDSTVIDHAVLPHGAVGEEVHCWIDPAT